MKSFITSLFILISVFALVSCGDDNTTTPNNPPAETLVYSRDTFNLSTSQQGNFYAYNEFTAIFDTSNTVKLTFSIEHNLDSTDSRGLFVWGNLSASISDSLNTSQLRGNHTIQVPSNQRYNALGFYNVIYYSSSMLAKYIKVRNFKIYKIN